MEPTEKAKHLAALRELTKKGGVIDTTAPTATQNNSANFNGGLPIGDRARLHKRILKEFFAEKPDVLTDRLAIVMSGPPGVGKSTALRSHIPITDDRLWRIIDADDFKKRLLKAMRAMGSYDEIIPNLVAARMDGGEFFVPGEFAALVHDESSTLAKSAAQVALTRGERIVLDGVNGTVDALLGRFKLLADNGYEEATVIVVDGSKTATRTRVEQRHSFNYDKAVNGDEEASYDARFVPEYVTDALYPDTDDHSSCRPAIAKIRGLAASVPLPLEILSFYVAGPTDPPTVFVP